jgi:hypothetical protein
MRIDSTSFRQLGFTQVISRVKVVIETKVINSALALWPIHNNKLQEYTWALTSPYLSFLPYVRV